MVVRRHGTDRDTLRSRKTKDTEFPATFIQLERPRRDQSIGPGEVAKRCAGTDQQIAVFAGRQQAFGAGGGRRACGERRHADQSGRSKNLQVLKVIFVSLRRPSSAVTA